MNETAGRTVVIGESLIPPGDRQRIDIPVARLPTGQPMAMPIIVVNGAEEGPSVWITAAVHGDEYNGIEIVRRVLTALVPSQVGGTVYAVPVVNAFGFISEQRYLPDRRDLNRSFPGSKTGSLAARIARLLLDTIVARCTVGIDLHTGSGGRSNLPQARVIRADADAVACGRVFAPPFLMLGSAPQGSFRAAATKRGAHVIVYEGGEAKRFDTSAIETGADGVLRVLAHLGMIADAPPAAHTPFESEKSTWVRALRSGLAQFWVSLGTHVKRRQPLGLIADTCGEIRAPITAPGDGLVVGLTMNPHVYRGDALVHIARRRDA